MGIHVQLLNTDSGTALNGSHGLLTNSSTYTEAIDMKMTSGNKNFLFACDGSATVIRELAVNSDGPYYTPYDLTGGDVGALLTDFDGTRWLTLYPSESGGVVAPWWRLKITAGTGCTVTSAMLIAEE